MKFTPKLKLPRPEPSDNHNLANQQLLVDRIEANAAAIGSDGKILEEHLDMSKLATKSEVLTGTGWQTPVLLNGYTKGNSVEPVRYKRVGNLLYLQVTAYGTAYGTSNPILTLPAGYRPEYNLFPAFTFAGSYKTVRGFIHTNGNVGISTSSSEASGMTGVLMHAVLPLA